MVIVQSIVQDSRFASATQPRAFDSEVFAFYAGGLVPIALWNRQVVGIRTIEPEEAEREPEPLFGTHIREAVENIRGLVRR